MKDPSTLSREGFIAGAKNGYNRGFREGMDKRKERDLAIARAVWYAAMKWERETYADDGSIPGDDVFQRVIAQVDASLGGGDAIAGTGNRDTGLPVHVTSLGGEASGATVTPSHYAEGIEAEAASRSGGLEPVQQAEPPSDLPTYWYFRWQAEQQRAAGIMRRLLDKERHLTRAEAESYIAEADAAKGTPDA